MAYKSSPRGARPVSLLAVHAAEGARTARSLASYFYRDDVQASAHDAIDSAERLHMVPYERAAWTLRSGNPISDNVELCAFSRWTRDQWLSTGTVDGCVNPRSMLDQLAIWIRERAHARGIPIRRLSVVQLQQGHWGVIEHWDWTKAFKDGTHWDCGNSLPWDYVLDQATQEDDDMAWSEEAAARATATGMRQWSQERVRPEADGPGRNYMDNVWQQTYSQLSIQEQLGVIAGLLTQVVERLPAPPEEQPQG